MGKAAHGRNLGVGLRMSRTQFTLQGSGSGILGSGSSMCGGVTGALGSRWGRRGGAGEG